MSGAISKTPGLPAAALGKDGRARFLVVCLGGIGRIVEGLPVLHALKRTYPDIEIGWAVDEAFARLLEGHPALSRVHHVPLGQWKDLSWWRRRRGRAEFAGQLRSHGYTAAVDLHGDRTSARITSGSRARMSVSYAPPEGTAFGRRRYTCRIIPSPHIKHVAERNLSLLVPFAVRREEPGYDFPDFAGARAGLARKLEGFYRQGRQGRQETPGALGDLGGKEPFNEYAVIHPGAGRPSRLWPVDHHVELARRVASELSLGVVVTAHGDPERSRAEAVAKGAGGGASVAPELELDELAVLLSDAALFAGGDTGPMHLASALGTPTVAIFGPTRIARRRPRGEKSRVADAGLGCAGCGGRTCHDGTDACMRDVSPGQVFELARELVG